MNWHEPVIDYCERLDGRFWAEPLNAVSNAAFLVAAAAAYALLRRQGGRDAPAAALIAVTATVGVGSFVFHTVATRGAMLLDVIPIAVFIYGYFLLALRRFFGLALAPAIAVMLAFAVASFTIDAHVKGLNGSVAYLPALAALLSFAALLWGRRPEAAKGLAAAAATFLVSLGFRTIDRDICASFPSGAHFLWHLLNACVLWLLLHTAILAKP
ncbi:ceramidase domain-containing protein [Methylocystis parvus]|uniref:ceramidase domain-containing protein n=1 Tax=Methylocystis parvus TaxID=134 RepID=UPI003C7221A6